MFATRPLRMELELLKWLALFILAAITAMLLLNSAGGVTLPKAPLLLPERVASDAQPLAVMPPADPNVRLWEIIKLQTAGQAEAALAAWKDVTLPPQTEVWRQICMAAANLQLGQADAAAEHLATALALEPHNPLVHYYTAILRLDQAQHAQEWYDAIGGDLIQLAVYRPQQVAPNTRGMYQLHAMMEFEQAIELAGHLDPAMALALPDYRTPATVPVVTVADLLKALGAEKFVGQSHNMLGAMCLEREALDLAETHMDAADEAGVCVVFGYRELGAAYETQGRYNDAARAFLKSIGHEGGVIRPMWRFLENVGNAVTQ